MSRNSSGDQEGYPKVFESRKDQEEKTSRQRKYKTLNEEKIPRKNLVNSIENLEKNHRSMAKSKKLIYKVQRLYKESSKTLETKLFDALKYTSLDSKSSKGDRFHKVLSRSIHETLKLK